MRRGGCVILFETWSKIRRGELIRKKNDSNFDNAHAQACETISLHIVRSFGSTKDLCLTTGTVVLHNTIFDNTNVLQ